MSNPFKIGDRVKSKASGAEREVIGVFDKWIWLSLGGIPSSYLADGYVIAPPSDDTPLASDAGRAWLGRTTWKNKPGYTIPNFLDGINHTCKTIGDVRTLARLLAMTIEGE